MINLYEFHGYKAYLIDYVEQNKNFKRKTIAEIIRVQTAYVSQVLNGHMHFNLEQAEMLSRALGHSPEETKYFLTLVQFERAGTTELQAYFKVQLEELKRSAENVTARMKRFQTITPEHQAQYYSSWHYQAIHYLTTIEKFKTPGEIARRLSLDLHIVSEALQLLTSCDLLEFKNGQYHVSKNRIHVDPSSPMNRQNHFNFRTKAMLAMSSEEPLDLHYTSVFTASLKDIQLIRAEILKKVEEINTIIAPSPEEELFNLGIDYYRIR